MEHLSFCLWKPNCLHAIVRLWHNHSLKDKMDIFSANPSGEQKLFYFKKSQNTDNYDVNTPLKVSVMQDLSSLCSQHIPETSERNYILLNEWGCDLWAGLDGERQQAGKIQKETMSSFIPSWGRRQLSLVRKRQKSAWKESKSDSQEEKSKYCLRGHMWSFWY